MKQFIIGIFIALMLAFTPAPAMAEVSSAPPESVTKLTKKLDCNPKTLTSRMQALVWECTNKSKTRAYSFISPSFAWRLFNQSGGRCVVRKQIWFTYAPNDWAVATATKSAKATRSLTQETSRKIRGNSFYVCAP